MKIVATIKKLCSTVGNQNTFTLKTDARNRYSLLPYLSPSYIVYTSKVRDGVQRKIASRWSKRAPGTGIKKRALIDPMTALKNGRNSHEVPRYWPLRAWRSSVCIGQLMQRRPLSEYWHVTTVGRTGTGLRTMPHIQSKESPNERWNMADFEISLLSCCGLEVCHKQA
jgi:hypothetical protein